MSNYRYGRDDYGPMRYQNSKKKHSNNYSQNNYGHARRNDNAAADENNDPDEENSRSGRKVQNSGARVTIAQNSNKPRYSNSKTTSTATGSSSNTNGGSTASIALDRDWPSLSSNNNTEGRESPAPVLVKLTQQANTLNKTVPVAASTGSTGSSGSTGSQFLSIPMVAPVKLIDEYGVFCEQDVTEFMTDGNSGFLIVGVVGLQCCGKSTLMNALARGGGRPGGDCGRPFEESAGVHVVENSLCTCGVDLLVTQERLVLLDTQPLLTMAVADALARPAPGGLPTTPGVGLLAPDYPGVDSGPEMAALQTAAFLLSVCHVVLVVSDQAADLGLLRLLEVADMLRPAAPDTTNHEQAADHVARLVFVYNKAERAAMTAPAAESLDNTLSTVFRQCSFRRADLVCLPRVRRVHDDGGLSAQEWESRVQDLRRQLLASSRSSLGATATQATAATSGPGGAVVSENRWLHFAGKTWEIIKKSSMFSEYHRLVT